jgi:hypothetical protein
VHVDWRVAYAPPTVGWRASAWKLAVRYGREDLVATFLKPRTDVYRWLQSNAGRFAFDIVVVGRHRRSPKDALQSLVLRDRLWVASVSQYEDWAAYARDAGQIPRLIELVVPEGVEAPVLEGLTVRPFLGQGHRIGQERSSWT